MYDEFFGDDYLGLSKAVIKMAIKRANLSYTEFACWLYVPVAGILLSFEGQYCQAISPLPLR